MSLARKAALLLVLALVTGGGLRAADPAGASKKSEMSVAGSLDLQKLISQFNARRDTMLADRDALLSQLKTATADQRKAIIAKMEAVNKDVLEQQRALGKQIRDEMKKLRESTPASGRR